MGVGHEQIVGMLPVRDGCSLVSLAGLMQQRVALAAGCEGLERKHAAKQERAPAGFGQPECFALR